jgi:hypothetical protein
MQSEPKVLQRQWLPTTNRSQLTEASTAISHTLLLYTSLIRHTMVQVAVSAASTDRVRTSVLNSKRCQQPQQASAALLLTADSCRVVEFEMLYSKTRVCEALWVHVLAQQLSLPQSSAGSSACWSGTSATALRKHVAACPLAGVPLSARLARLFAYVEVTDEALRPAVDRAQGLAVQPQRFAVHVAGGLPCSQTAPKSIRRVQGAFRLAMCSTQCGRSRGQKSP